MKYWQNLKSQMDVTANHLLASGMPGYNSVTLISLIIMATLLRNFGQKISNFRYAHNETKQEV